MNPESRRARGDNECLALDSDSHVLFSPASGLDGFGDKGEPSMTFSINLRKRRGNQRGKQGGGRLLVYPGAGASLGLVCPDGALDEMVERYKRG